MKQNDIRNIALKIGRDISSEDYGTISTSDKNSESGYYLVKWTSESYTFQYSRQLGNCFIKAGDFVCDVVYFNKLDNFNQWYNPYKYENEGKNCQVEYCYFK